MPAFSFPQVSAKIYCGIVSIFPTITVNAAAQWIGHRLLEIEGDIHPEISIMNSAIGGCITGTFASLAFVEEVNDRPWGIRLYRHVTDTGLLLPLFYLNAATLVGDAISTHEGFTCNLSNLTGKFDCPPEAEFLSVYAKSTMIGSMLLAPAMSVGFAIYKKLTRLCEEKQTPSSPSHFPSGGLESKVQNCHYNGNIPADYNDPVHYTLMDDPIILHCGHNLDRSTLRTLRQHTSNCPCCRAPIRPADFEDPTPNIYLRSNIHNFVATIEEESKSSNVTVSVDVRDDTQIELNELSSSGSPSRLGFFGRVFAFVQRNETPSHSLNQNLNSLN